MPQMPKGRPCHMQGLSNSRHRSLGEERAKARSLCQLLSASCSRLPLCPFNAARALFIGQSPQPGASTPPRAEAAMPGSPLPSPYACAPHTPLTTANPRLFFMCLFLQGGGRGRGGGDVIWDMKKEPVLKTSTHQAPTQPQRWFQKARSI